MVAGTSPARGLIEPRRASCSCWRFPGVRASASRGWARGVEALGGEEVVLRMCEGS